MNRQVKGSGGYIIADLREDEESKALGNNYFIGVLGKIDKERILSYYCNSCNKDIQGAPSIKLEDLREEIEGIIIKEEGSYICKECNAVIGTWKIFKSNTDNIKDEEKRVDNNIIPLSKFIGMSVFDDNARSIGRVRDLCLKGNQLILQVENDGIIDIEWSKIIALRDIVLVKSQSNRCKVCNYINKENARFCEECGSTLT